MTKLAFNLNAGAEIYEQTVVNTGGGEIMYELHLVLWGKSENCFDFDD